MKLCKDCKFCKPRSVIVYGRRDRWEHAICLHPRSPGEPRKLSRITGKLSRVKLRDYQSCDLFRRNILDSDCGREAKYFEPREDK